MNLGLSVIALSVLFGVTVPGANGQGVLPVESSLSLDPIVSLVGCLREDKPGYCIQRRALGMFESWITGGGEDEDEIIASGDSEGGDKSPALSPSWTKMIDSVAERIANIYGVKDDEDDEKDQTNARNQIQDSNSSQVEGMYVIDGRGHKKKKVKAIKKAIIKLVLIALLIKSKIKMLLVALQTFLAFKAALLATVYVIIHAVKLWVEVKHKHHPQKVIYYENAHHQHHYDDHHDHHDHDDHHHGWSLWGRSGSEATTAPPSIYPGLAGYFTKRSSDLPYAAHAPLKTD